MAWTSKMLGGLRAIPLCAAALAGANAQADQIYHYAGTLGDMKVDVVLEAEKMDDGFGGLLVTERDSAPVVLERTPYFEGEPFLIAVRDKTEIPTAAVEFRPFDQGARYLFGRWIDLRTREERKVDLQLVKTFDDGVSTLGYEGELLQQPISALHRISVHADNREARARRDSSVGKVDQITVRSKSGEVIQVIDGLSVVFKGTRTLESVRINDDHNLDFVIRTLDYDPATGDWDYGKQLFFVYQESLGRYEPQVRLNEWAEKGLFYYQEKPGHFRYEKGSDCRCNAPKDGIYRVVGDEVEPVTGSER
jgi:hypothetical protein